MINRRSSSVDCCRLAHGVVLAEDEEYQDGGSDDDDESDSDDGVEEICRRLRAVTAFVESAVAVAQRGFAEELVLALVRDLDKAGQRPPSALCRTTACLDFERLESDNISGTM